MVKKEETKIPCDTCISSTFKLGYYLHELCGKAITKMSKKEKDKITKRLAKKGGCGAEVYFMECNYYQDLEKIVEEYSARDVIEQALGGIKGKADMIKFSLIDRYEFKDEDHEYLTDGALRERTDPLGCIDLYIKHIRKKLIQIEEVLNKREWEIRKQRGEK